MSTTLTCSRVATFTTLAAAFVATPLNAEPARTLKIGYILSTNSQLGAGAKAFADELEKRTKGRHQGRAVSQLGARRRSRDAQGRAARHHRSRLHHGGAATQHPAGSRRVQHPVRVPRCHARARGAWTGRSARPICRSSAPRISLRSLGARTACATSPIPSARSARAEDLKGLKLRLPQSEVMLAGFKALGADVAPLAFPQLYGALQSGQFDGQENPIATIVASKFAQVQKYLTVSGHVYDPAVIVMSVDAFEELDEGAKEAVFAAAKLGAQASRAYAAEAQAKGVAALAQAGMEVTTEIDKAKFAAAMAGAMPEFEKRFGADVIGKLRNAK